MPARVAWEARPAHQWRAVVAVLLAAWVFWLVLRSAVLHVFAQRDPGIVAQLRPVPTLSLVRQARALPADTPEARALYARIAAADPLEPAPYRDAAHQALATGDLTRAHALLEAAATRAPRDAVIQLELLRLYLRLGLPARAIDAADRAMRLAREPEVARALAPTLSRYAAAEGASETLAQALARGPVWARHMASDAPATLSPELVDDLIASEAEQDPQRRRRAAQTARLTALLDRGDTRGAARAFANYVPEGVTGVPYDREFAALAGPPPLNWRMSSGTGGAAAIRFDDGHSDGYLRADLTGEGGAALAEQVILLPPGRYHLAARMRALPAPGEREARPGVAAMWRVACRGSGASLALLPAYGADWRVGAARFTVPARGCGAQTVALLPLPGSDVAALATDWVRIDAQGER